MVDYLEGLPGLGRRSVTDLLQELNSLRLKSRTLGPTARPLLTLHLHGGQAVSGWLLDYGPGEGTGAKDPVALLHVAWPDEKRPAEAVAYVPARDIQAVTVFEATAAARHLLPPMTKMELRRLADRVGQDLSSLFGKTWTFAVHVDQVPEQALPALADSVRAVQGALTEMHADALARQALVEKVKGLALEAGAALQAQMSGGTLKITAPTGSAEVLSAAAAKAAIEDAL